MISDNSTFYPTRLYGDGITIREYFAAVALQGLLAANLNSEISAVVENLCWQAVVISDCLATTLNKVDAAYFEKLNSPD